VGVVDRQIAVPSSPSGSLLVCAVPFVLAASSSVGHVKDAYWNPDASFSVSSLFLP
jgi:hypothetical protein